MARTPHRAQLPPNLPGTPADGPLAAEAINHVLGGARGRKAVHLCFGNYGGQTVQKGFFPDLLPFFKRSENAEGRDPAVRGGGGPLTPGPAVHRHPIAEAGLEAAGQAGYPVVRDITSGLEQGFGWGDLSIVDGRRQSAADSPAARSQAE